MKITAEFIKDRNAEFQYFRDNKLWYKVGDFLFPVPVEDIGMATFNRDDKAIYFMRWIRKFNQEIENGK